MWTIDPHEAAVLDARGRLRVVDLQTGKDRAAARLDAVENLESVAAFKAMDNYIIAANVPSEVSALTFRYNLIGGVPVHGRVYGVSPAGEVVWRRRAADQLCRVDQPRRAPALVFYNQRTIYDEDARRNVDELLCLDPRTGDVLVRESAAGAIYQYELDANVEAGLLHLRTRAGTYKLTCREK